MRYDACSQFNFHLTQRFPDGCQQSVHIRWKNSPDAANPETIGVAYLTRVNDIVPLVQCPIELFKIKVGMIGVGERGDNEALIFGFNIFFETYGPHTGD